MSRTHAGPPPVLAPGPRRAAGGTADHRRAGPPACQIPSLQDVTLPGGNATGGDVFRVSVVFDDVLDLVPQAAVQVDNVAVGDVESVELDRPTGSRPRCVLRLRDSVDLPENTVARLQTTSLLGEKYVALSRAGRRGPAGSARRRRRHPNGDSSRDVEMEEVLSALSLLLNGGGVEQLQTINTELTATLQGREADVKSLLTQLNVFLSGPGRAEGRDHPRPRGPRPAVGEAVRAEEHHRDRAHRHRARAEGHQRAGGPAQEHAAGPLQSSARSAPGSSTRPGTTPRPTWRG